MTIERIERHVVIEWTSGQQAILSLAGWRVDRYDDLLEELLQRDCRPKAMQRWRAPSGRS